MLHLLKSQLLNWILLSSDKHLTSHKKNTLNLICISHISVALLVLWDKLNYTIFLLLIICRKNVINCFLGLCALCDLGCLDGQRGNWWRQKDPKTHLWNWSMFVKLLAIDYALFLSCLGVHCTHGFNRTGFLICAFLVEKMDWR